MHSPLSPARAIDYDRRANESVPYRMQTLLPLACTLGFLFFFVLLPCCPVAGCRLPCWWVFVALLCGLPRCLCCLVAFGGRWGCGGGFGFFRPVALFALLPLLPCCAWVAVGFWGVLGGVLSVWGLRLVNVPHCLLKTPRRRCYPGGELINFFPPLPSLLRLLLGPAAGCAVGSLGAAVLPV